MTIHRTSIEDAQLSSAGWVEVPSLGVQVTRLPLVDSSKGEDGDGHPLFARLTYADAKAWAEARGFTLVRGETLEALRELDNVLVIEPNALPHTQTLAGSREHDRRVWDDLAAACWDEIRPVLGVGKHHRHGAPPGRAYLGGWWTEELGLYSETRRGPGWVQRIDTEGQGPHVDGIFDYATLTLVERTLECREPARPRTTRPGEKGDDVLAWQTWLLREGYELPRYGADGDHGGETENATNAWIADHATEIEPAPETDWCGKRCDHDSPCLLPEGHEPADRHETEHGCAFFDGPPDAEPGPDPEPQTLIELVDETILSRNHGPKRETSSIIWVVLHSMEGGTAHAVARWFGGPSAPQASCHLSIGPEVIISCLPLDVVAWCAPGANRLGVHIEQEGYAMKTDWMSGDGHRTMSTSALATAAICRELSLPIEVVDAEGMLELQPGITTHSTVTDACRLARQRGIKSGPFWDARRGRWKHTDHRDPGGPGDKRWPWDEFLRLVRRG
jgi:hypothetical protein